MHKPRALRPGDRLAVVAPASTFPRDEFEAGLQELRRLGFIPVYEESVFERERYLAGSARSRAAALDRAWRDPSVAGVIGVRGGYGSAQLLPLLDPEAVRIGCKPFIGYSDLTAILTFLTVHCHLVAFHGPMLARRLGESSSSPRRGGPGKPGGYDPGSFVRALCDREPLGELTADTVEVIRPGEAGGPLYGGTVTQLLASLGTPYAFAPPQGHVLFLDEVGERPYRLDRMITQLRQTGLLARAIAVVVGELPGCDEPSGNLTGRAVMADLLADFPGPAIIGFPSGHTSGPALTLPFGVATRVVARPQPRLVIEESAVA